MSLNPNQFKLFYSAGELQNHLTASNDRAMIPGQGRESMGDMWDRKLRESQHTLEDGKHGSGTFDSIKQHGYREGMDITGGPLNVIHGGGSSGDTYVHQGHHRIAAAAEVERTTGKTQWINTEHTDPRPLRMQGMQGRPTATTKYAAANPGLHAAIEDLVKKITG